MSLEFRCRNVGVVCSAKITADTKEELLALVAEHADHVHGVPELSQTLVNYAVATVVDNNPDKPSAEESD